MKNFVMNIDLENNQFNFIVYYFNGIPRPKDIEYKLVNNIFNASVTITWKIDKYENIDDKLLSFVVDIKEEGQQFFTQKYKGKDLSCNIYLSQKKNIYEYRVSTLYNDLIIYTSDIKILEINKANNNNFVNNNPFRQIIP